MDGISTFMEPSQAGFFLAVGQAALSLSVLVLVGLVWSRQVAEGTGACNEWDGITSKLNGISDELTKIPKTIESEGSRRLKRILEAYDAWAEVAMRDHLPSALIREIQTHHECLADLLILLQMRQEEGQFFSRIQQTTNQAILDASLKSDQDLDRRRVNKPLQDALDALMNSAEMRLICPKKGKEYRRVGDDFPRRVDSVETRGVSDRNGTVLREPEIIELR